MFSGKRGEYDGVSTVIAKGVKIEGATLIGVGRVRIDGEFLGEMDIDGEINLGDTGVFEGNIHAKSALISGHVLGNLFVSGNVHLTSTADVVGNIESSTLIVDEGSSFSGNSKMRGRDIINKEEKKDNKVEDINNHINAVTDNKDVDVI